MHSAQNDEPLPIVVLFQLQPLACQDYFYAFLQVPYEYVQVETAGKALDVK